MKNSILSHQELSAFCRELSLLLQAGENPDGALSILAEEGGDPELLKAISQGLDQGLPLHSAMRETGRFPEYVCGLLEASQISGKTVETLVALSQYYQERIRLDRRIRSALLYPAVMLLLMLVVIAVLLVKVLPIFNDVYASLGGRLSGVAGGLLHLGRWLDRAMPVLWVLLVLAAAALLAFSLVPAVREKTLAFWRRHWGDKGVSRLMNDAHVAQAVALVLAGGLPLEEALAQAAGLVDESAGKRCQDCRERLERGETTGEAMRGSNLLPLRACRLMALGERSGASDVAMNEIASTLSEESEAALEERVSRVEPALVLVCSLLVGLILLSVMLPLTHIMAAIG